MRHIEDLDQLVERVQGARELLGVWIACGAEECEHGLSLDSFMAFLDESEGYALIERAGLSEKKAVLDHFDDLLQDL